MKAMHNGKLVEDREEILQVVNLKRMAACVGCVGVSTPHFVTLTLKRSTVFPNPKWVLRIEGTPGSWYLSTLLEGSPTNTIWIDLGQDWKCINLLEILREAVRSI